MVQLKTWYMDHALFELSEVIERGKIDLAHVDFDTLVGTGFSGAVVIPSLALALGKKFVLIRKENDDSHHGGGNLLGELGKKWIFVDDFVSSGRTRNRVIEKIEQAVSQYSEYDVRTEMVGQYMYVNYSEFGPQFEPVRQSKSGYAY